MAVNPQTMQLVSRPYQLLFPLQNRLTIHSLHQTHNCLQQRLSSLSFSRKYSPRLQAMQQAENVYQTMLSYNTSTFMFKYFALYERFVSRSCFLFHSIHEMPHNMNYGCTFRLELVTYVNSVKAPLYTSSSRKPKISLSFFFSVGNMTLLFSTVTTKPHSCASFFIFFAVLFFRTPESLIRAIFRRIQVSAIACIACLSGICNKGKSQKL